MFMDLNWKGVLAFLLFVSVATHASAQKLASEYPLRPIQMIIPLAAGSAGDAALRVVTAKMAIDLRKQIVIENVPGAAGMIGATRAARATPDGYTIVGISDSVLTSVPLLNKNAKFDPLKDFDPVSQIVTNEWVLVANPSFPAKSVQDLVALAKSEPGTIDFSSGGNGSPQHIAMEMLMARTGTKLVHVPYRGATSALTDVVAGTVPLMFTAIAVAQPFLKDGKLRAIATGGPQRSELLPDVPTVAEAGVTGFAWSTWTSIMVPAGTPAPIVAKLHTAVVAALNDTDVCSKLLALGVVPNGNTPEEFRADLARSYSKMADIIKAAGIKVE
jgi:tripartite-type tricarboxylate transporter receptor subunit TctC